MAIVILGGLFTATLLNLFVLPSLYLRFGAEPGSHDGRARAGETERGEWAPGRDRRSRSAPDDEPGPASRLPLACAPQPVLHAAGVPRCLNAMA